MTTPRDIILQALKMSQVIGVGQSAAAEDITDSFTQLNFMLAQWSRKRFLVYHLVELSVTCNGSPFYTVGPGGDMNVAQRPDSIASAFLRQNTGTAAPIDYQVTVIKAREDYNRIALKTLNGGITQYVFYDTGYPVGNIYPWPLVGGTQWSLHFFVKDTLTQFTSLSQDIILPPEYLAAIQWNLAKKIRLMYGVNEHDGINAEASDALATIRGANAQIPTLTLPDNLVERGGYNIYSDTMV